MCTFVAVSGMTSPSSFKPKMSANVRALTMRVVLNSLAACSRARREASEINLARAERWKSEPIESKRHAVGEDDARSFQPDHCRLSGAGPPGA